MESILICTKMDDKEVENFVSSIIRKISCDISTENGTSGQISKEENRGDLHKESENVVVFNKFDESRKGKKAPRYLLVQASKSNVKEENTNNHRVALTIDDKFQTDTDGLFLDKSGANTNDQNEFYNRYNKNSFGEVVEKEDGKRLKYKKECPI